ncbi:MAG: bifunctional aspartokinase / homoserine dehydrogenase 1 [Acidobacteriota bacterium]|nr:bifunctional aspartokinase / homoserine dehydrogenase 1 [Acidobacteriota bacterium]
MQSFRVMKFGGTSVAGADRMRAVADLVAGAAATERVGVVASAVSGVTDLLIQGLAHAVAGRREEAEATVLRFRELHLEIARELGEAFGAPGRTALEEQLSALAAELAEVLRGVALLGDCSPRVEARVIVLGERASCALLFELFASCGLDVEALDPKVVLPCAGDPRAATPQPAEMHRRLAARRDAGSRVLLMPGFFGGDDSGQVMCLGRGGSDYSAALLAQALEARLLEIWTDVDGVFTTDPRLAPAATCLERMSYEEAMELAHFGAKVLHPRTIAPARAAGVPVRIRNTFRPEHPGTLVERRSAVISGVEGAEGAERVACGISFTRGVALVSLFGPGMEGVPGVAARLFAALASRGISVMLITQGSSETAISFCIGAGAADEAERAVRAAFESEIDTGRVDEVVARRDLAIVSLVGDGMRERVGVAGRFFGALGNAGVNVAAIAQGASERSISAVIAAVDGARAVAAVHERLFERPWQEGSPTLFSPAKLARKLSGALPESGWVTAYAPAGIGNFAAGFDLLGAALAPLDGDLWGDCVDARRAVGREAGEGDRLECRGRFAHRLPAEPLENLVLKARDAFASRFAEPLPALDFVLHKNLPVASGLGSSASSVAATLVALNELFGQPLDDRALLAAAGEAEAQASGGVHLDNVAPALLGGLRLVDPESGSRGLPFPEELVFVLWVPALELETRFARSVLPREVPLPDAIAWAQNLGALVHALHTGDRHLLRVTLRDSLAEPHRAALVPGFRDVQRAALAAGALGCTLSGAGPAVFAVVELAAAEAIAAAGLDAWRAAGVAVEARLCRLDLRGARRADASENAGERWKTDGER